MFQAEIPPRALASMLEAIIETDAAGVIVSLNDAALAITGGSRDDAVGRSLGDVLRNDTTRDLLFDATDDDHPGVVHIESSPGIGTTVRLFLPRSSSTTD